jgi:hypothetical protein
VELAEKEEREAREFAFFKAETPWCTVECYANLAHSEACLAVGEPVRDASTRWRNRGILEEVICLRLQA